MASPLPGLDVPVVDPPTGRMMHVWFDYFQSIQKLLVGLVVGNVSNSGTPASGQYAKWVTATTIQGVAPATVLTDIAALPLAGGTLTGGLGVGATAGSLPGWFNSNIGIDIATTAYIAASSGTSPVYIANLNANGGVTNFFRSGTQVGSISVTTTATAYNTSSDERLKEDLKSFDAGRVVDETNVYDFAWKTTGERSYGVIAQQANEIYPAAVFHDEANDQWLVDYSKYVPVLLQELKALRARVAKLETATKG